MAHVEKFARPQVGAMKRHYFRENENYENANIDPSRTHLNFNCAPVKDTLEAIRAAQTAHEGITGKSLRKDAIVMADWVLTAPQDLKTQDLSDFFYASYDFFKERYGSENVLSAWVHMDETTPHMHFSFMPVRDGKFNAKAIINRSDLKTLHGDLTREIEGQLGYKVSILLDDDKSLEKSLSRLPREEYVPVAQHIVQMRREEKELTERLELLRQGESELTTGNSDLRERSDGLTADRIELEGDCSKIDNAIAELRAGNERLRSGISETKHSIREGNERFGAVRAATKRAGDRIGELRSRIQDVGHRLAQIKELVKRMFPTKARMIEAQGYSDSRNVGIPKKNLNKDKGRER